MITTKPINKLKSKQSELWHSFKQHGCENARETLIIEFLYLVKNAAIKLAVSLPSFIELEDLFASGLLGLIWAIDRYDPGRGIKFKTYAIARIRGAMVDELRKQDWLPRSMRHNVKLLENATNYLETRLGHSPSDQDIANHIGISLKEYYKLLNKVSPTNLISLDQTIKFSHEELYSIVSNSLTYSDELNPYKRLEEQDLFQIIKETIESLPEKERLVLVLYYYDELTLKEIGNYLEVTESRACQIHTKAVSRLKLRINRLLNNVPSR
ncbi:MAG: FliA/WhiG family RNA polymerase sigma factor [Candidatus Krumholzibacteria bacterium]|nr:FliA/WhiG family RNA polymerase sigma factor [Candidatus Krumholzibacteria bacterium]